MQGTEDEGGGSRSGGGGGIGGIPVSNLTHMADLLIQQQRLLEEKKAHKTGLRGECAQGGREEGRCREEEDDGEEYEIGGEGGGGRGGGGDTEDTLLLEEAVGDVGNATLDLQDADAVDADLEAKIRDFRACCDKRRAQADIKLAQSDRLCCL
jgi:hypothetical protein